MFERGGRNIGNEYLGLSPDFNFRDLDVLGMGFSKTGTGFAQGIITNNNPFVPVTKLPGKASGGWVGLSGPEVVRVGERGPEYIIPNGGGGGGGAPVVLQIMMDGREVARVVDERLFFKYRTAGRGGATA